MRRTTAPDDPSALASNRLPRYALRASLTPQRFNSRRKLTPRKDIPQPTFCVEGSEEDNSLSSPCPLSPPRNTKRIDFYFGPKEILRQPAPPLPDSHSNLSTLSLPSQDGAPLASPAKTLPDPADNRDDPSPAVPGVDSRAKDPYTLLIARDRRIKELEHVSPFPRFDVGAERDETVIGGSAASGDVVQVAAGGAVESARELPRGHRPAARAADAADGGGESAEGARGERADAVDPRVRVLLLARKTASRGADGRHRRTHRLAADRSSRRGNVERRSGSETPGLACRG